VNPALSVVLFTTIAGAAQGLVLTLALAELARLPISAAFFSSALLLALVMLLVGLGASFAQSAGPCARCRCWPSCWRRCCGTAPR
jgi:DMSO reductase anchor subunit